MVLQPSWSIILRNMAKDNEQLELALERWDSLHAEKAYSVPSEIGKTVILASNMVIKGEDYSAVEAFNVEGRHLVDVQRSRGKAAEFIAGATATDMKAVLTDPTVTNIVTIGHGSFSSLSIDNGWRIRNLTENDQKVERLFKYNTYDWRDVAADADHLKAGFFIQRQCGHFGRRLSVPLGAFAMQSHKWVYAAIGNYLEPETLPDSLFDYKNLSLLPTRGRLSYDEIKSTYRMPRVRYIR